MVGRCDAESFRNVMWSKENVAFLIGSVAEFGDDRGQEGAGFRNVIIVEGLS